MVYLSSFTWSLVGSFHFVCFVHFDSFACFYLQAIHKIRWNLSKICAISNLSIIIIIVIIVSKCVFVESCCFFRLFVFVSHSLSLTLCVCVYVQCPLTTISYVSILSFLKCCYLSKFLSLKKQQFINKSKTMAFFCCCCFGSGGSGITCGRVTYI